MANFVDVILRVKSQGEAAIRGVQQQFAGLGVALVRRKEELDRFNQSIRNGDRALQQLFGAASLVFGVQVLQRYAAAAKEADDAQAQLNQTLRRTGETSAAPGLSAQADALERVTNFSGEAIKSVQRLLVTFGLSGQQAQALTESVLDFAQATGTSAESAAGLVGKMLLGDKDTLGRYNIKLDTTKGKVDSLRDALVKLAAGEARGAVADPTRRANEVAFEDATKDLGRAYTSAVQPVLQALLPLVQAVAVAVKELEPVIRVVAAAIAELATKLGPAVLAVSAFSLAIKALMIPINLARSAIFALAGQPFLALNASFAKSGGLAKAFALSITTLGGIGRLAAAGLSIIGAALVGWNLGKFINEIEVSGLKIKDWVAIAIVWIGDKFGAVMAGLRIAWAATLSAGESFWNSLKFATLSGVIAIIEAWNRLPFGQRMEVDLSPLRREFDETFDKIISSGDRLKAEIRRINDERAKQMFENLDLMAYIDAEGRKIQSGEAAGADSTAGIAGAPGPRPDLNDQRFGDTESDRNKRADFEAETAILQARLAGNQALVDQLTRARERQQALNALGEDAVDIVEQRLTVEDQLRAKERARTAEEIAFAQRLGDLDIRRADIEANRLITQQEKQRQVNQLLIEQNQLIAEKLALNEAALTAGTTEEERTRLLQEIATLRKQLAENSRTRESNRELTVGEGITAGVSSFITSLGTAADNAAKVVSGSLNTALTSTSDLLYNLATGATSWKDAWQTAILDVGRSFLRMVTDMVAKEAWRVAFGQKLKAVEVAGHVTAESAKTAASTQGFAARLAITAKEALAFVYQGAVKAFSAMASIPYVGPVLGAAAMAAALGAGIGLVSQIGKKEGGFTMDGPADKPAGIVHAGEWVAPKWMVDNPRFQPVISMLEGIRTGAPGFAAGGFVPNLTRPSFGPAGQGSGTYAAEGPAAGEGRPLNLTLVDSRREANRIQWNSSTEDQIVEIVRRNRSRVMT